MASQSTEAIRGLLNPTRAVPLLIVLFVFSCFYSARQKSVTMDEFVYIVSGYSYLRTSTTGWIPSIHR